MKTFENNLTGKKVLVMGLGRNNGGAGSVVFALKSGASEIIANDMKDKNFNKPSIDFINDFISKNDVNTKITYIFDGHHDEDFLWADVIIKNPGVPYSNHFIKLAQENGKTIETEMTLFLKQRNKNSTVIGITGSKGKTSTTHLITHILNFAKEKGKLNREIFMGGNMGISMLDSFDENFDGIYVVEMSSFVTEAIYTEKLFIDYFLITSLFADHLNYYNSLDQYYHSKVDLIKNLNPQNVYVNYANNDLAQYTKDFDINKIYTTNQEKLIFPDFFNEGLKQNATLVAEFLHAAFNFDYSFIIESFNSFKLAEGRFEPIGESGNVKFINDACASIPEAAMIGLQTLVNQNRNIYQITGGSDKGLKFDDYFKYMNEHDTKIYLIKGGNTFDLFVNALDSEKTVICENLEDAVNKAYEDAKSDSNSTIILSRGCTSFGLANNEFEMSRDFVKFFEQIKSKN